MTSKVIKTFAGAVIGVFAVIGFLFTFVFVGMRFELFTVRGSISERNSFFSTAATPTPCSVACDWQASEEWPVVREGLRKDAETILRVSKETSVPARLIAAVVVPEQIRFFSSEREVFKQVFEPLKILGSLSQFSLGVSGIKQETALDIERLTPPELQNLIAYPENKHSDDELFNRLTDPKDHYYSYLYTALYIRIVLNQWGRAGFPIDYQPGVVATLFNIGIGNSRPHAEPQIGGAEIVLGDTVYTFGELARLFYDSNELADIFPK